jgi:hypothetical protein
LKVSPQFKEAFNTVIMAQTRRLLETVSFLVEARARNTQSQRLVTMDDVYTAVDILGLPRHFALHFSTLPSRILILRESLEGKSITSNTQNEDLEAGKVIQYSRFTKLKTQFPDKWDIKRGFDWKKHPEKADLDDETAEISSEDPDPTEDESEEQDEREEQDESDGDEEAALLDAETEYLETYDAQLDHIELDRLRNLIKMGTRKAHALHRAALKKFPSKQTFRARKKWHSSQKRWVSKRQSWVDYQDGEGDMEPREWEAFWKRNPNPPLRPKVTREEGEQGQINRGRKRRFEEDEEESD